MATQTTMQSEAKKKLREAKKRDAAKAKKNHGWYLKECDRNKRKQKKYRGF